MPPPSTFNAQDDLQRQKNEELLESVEEGNVPAASTVLEVGASIDKAINANGCTALHIACHRGDTKMLAFLLTWKPDLEVRTKLLKITPLHAAINSKSADCVSLLLDAGADFESQTDTGERPVHLAIRRTDIEILKLLLRRGANSDAPAPCIWDSQIPRTPQEMAEQLPAMLCEQVLNVFEGGDGRPTQI
mmetsp:Transcript_25542/g.51915  ORF Transcript_25542/g.51915 Transcript_25542/m.51915 type:complete len:190 (+) Transcript_25542:162-731(+)|eukprot:CAMPEP_0181298034 /NCGR_PEP_ID=MMETSP1101-20121128/5568_1 /TAXON_ID=46948 /ORGANISM="Rhodomonas abbreviata, Strain Caron Lab Isolate" /LENGTH=189 /DNA_ID=CAMNT_0023403031 /DNA_START=158 /DNA_END=727 /DNA_ORIENTATION=+